MSRLTIYNSNNNLGFITLDNDKCTFSFAECIDNNINSSTVIYNNSTPNHTKVIYDNNIIETYNEGIVISHLPESTKIKTNDATVFKDGFKIVYDNNNYYHTTISYDNGIVVQAGNDKLDIHFLGNYIEFESNSVSSVSFANSNIIVCSCENSITKLFLDVGFNTSPITLNNQSESLETVSVNTDTIFNNLRKLSKVSSINISKGKNFEQTGNDLAINELKLDLTAKIQFTHKGSNYKFFNSPITNNDLVIKNLHNLVEKAKSFKDEYSFENWSGYDDLTHSFILQNEECLGISPYLL